MPLISRIKLEGSLDWLQLRLVWIQQVVKHRKTGGWPLFLPDEDWSYETAKDHRVCPICQGFEDASPWKGNEITHFFPKYEIVSPRSSGAYTIPVTIRPRVHRDPQYSDLKGECRCTLTFMNATETLAARLHEEMVKALDVS